MDQFLIDIGMVLQICLALNDNFAPQAAIETNVGIREVGCFSQRMCIVGESTYKKGPMVTLPSLFDIPALYTCIIVVLMEMHLHHGELVSDVP